MYQDRCQLSLISAAGKVASGAFYKILAVRYCQCRRAHGLGSLWNSGVLLSSMSPGRVASVENSNQCHGVPVLRARPHSFLGWAPITRYAQCVSGSTHGEFILSNPGRRVVRWFKEASHCLEKGIPTRQVRPVTRPCFLSLHNCFLSKTTIYGGRTLVPLPGRRGCNFFFS